MDARFEHHAPPERERGLLAELVTARRVVERARELDAIWTRFAEAQGDETARPPYTTTQLIQDVERLVRAPEFRAVFEEPPRVGDRIALLADRMGAGAELTEALRRVHHEGAAYGRTAPQYWWRAAVFIIEIARNPSLAERPPESDILTPARGERFGVVDADARDALFDRIASIADLDVRRDAARHAFAIDPHAALYRIPSFGFPPEDAAGLYRFAAREVPDALAPYLGAVAEEDPTLARELADGIVARDLLSGCEAIDALTLPREERRAYEKRLVALHPADALRERVALDAYLRALPHDEALRVAVTHLEHALSRNPLERLAALDVLTHDDADIADLLAPVVRRALRDAAAQVSPHLDALRADVAGLRAIAPDELPWDDVYSDLLWDSPTMSPSPEDQRFAQARPHFGPSRVRAMVLAAASAERGSCYVGWREDHTLTPTAKRALLAEILDRDGITPPAQEDETAGWGALAFAPRTAEEEALMERALAAMVRVAPQDYVQACAVACRSDAAVRRELPHIRTLDASAVGNALSWTDDHGVSRALALADPELARELIDRAFSGDAHVDSNVYLLDDIPRRYRAFVLPHIERYRKANIAPYTEAPTAALTVRLAGMGTRSLRIALASFSPERRSQAYGALEAFFTQHGALGERALRSLNAKADFIPAGLQALSRMLTEHGDLFQKREAARKERPFESTDWDRLAPFLAHAAPERVPELMRDILPQFGRKGAPTEIELLLRFRLRADAEEIRALHVAPFTLSDIARAPNPGRLLAFIARHQGELREIMNEYRLRDTLADYIAAQDDPEVAWAFVRRFADQFSSMEPEDERRAATAMEIALRLKEHRSHIFGFVRRMSAGRGDREAKERTALLRRLADPDVDDAGIALASLTERELAFFLKKRLRDVLREPVGYLMAADVENRRIAEELRNGTWTFPAGTLIHYGSAEVIPAILAQGNLCGEALGLAGGADSFPLHVDAVRVRDADASLSASALFTHAEYYRAFSTYDRGVAFCYPRRGDSRARFPGEEIPTATRADVHHLFFGAIPRSELGCIVLTPQDAEEDFDRTLARAKDAVVQANVYVPIADIHGMLLFTPAEFDALTAERKPYASLDALLADDRALNHLDRPQKSAVHAFTLKEHLLIAEREARTLAKMHGVPERLLPIIAAAARLHDVGKFEAEETGQEIANVIAAERELDKVRFLDPEVRRQILVLIRHDELLGDILQGTNLAPDGSVELSDDAERRIEEFHLRFPKPVHRTLMRIVYEADVRAIGNGMVERWDVAAKLAALSDRLFAPTTPTRERRAA